MNRTANRSTGAAFVFALLALVGSANAQTATGYPTIQSGQPGITGYYYQLTDPVAAPDRATSFSIGNFINAQIDPQIAFDSVSDFDGGQVGPNGFVVRWIGQLRVPSDGSYVISSAADDGMNVWLSENPIDPVTPDQNASLFDGWPDDSLTAYASAPLALSASKSYYLMVEYYQNTGSAVCHLKWTIPGATAPVDIPTSAFTSLSLSSDSHGTASGAVVDSSGKAFAGIQVAFVSGSSSYVATTDDKGAYNIALLPGSYSVVGGAPVQANYSNLPTSPITVTADKTVTVPTITAAYPSFFETTTTSAYDDDFTGTTLDSKWKDVDLDNATDGSAVANKGELDVTAGGWDINDDHDGENYAYQTVTGDFALTVEVIGIPENQDWEMGGPDIRATADKDAAHAFFQTMKSHGFQHKIRQTKAAMTAEYDLSSDTTGTALWPVWLKIRRIGDKVAFFWTEDPTKGTVNAGFVKTIVGFKGFDQLTAGITSCAHDDSIVDPGFTYAHFRIEPIATTTTPSIALGDLNDDGKINVSDATISLRIAVGLTTPTADQKTAGDVNNDGKLSVADTTLILQVAVGLKSGF